MRQPAPSEGCDEFITPPRPANRPWGASRGTPDGIGRCPRRNRAAP
jgi:hypothetical protein